MDLSQSLAQLFGWVEPRGMTADKCHGAVLAAAVVLVAQQQEHVVFDCFAEDLEHLGGVGGRRVDGDKEAGDFVAELCLGFVPRGFGLDETEHGWVSCGEVGAEQVCVEFSDGRVARWDGAEDGGGVVCYDLAAGGDSVEVVAVHDDEV